MHNVNYWRNGPCVAVGPSAAGFDGRRRYKNVADVAGYVRMIDERGHAEVDVEIVEGETLALEMILMQLRLIEGLSIADFHHRTGVDPRALFDGALERLTGDGLVTVSERRIALTHRGRLVGDWVMGELAADCDWARAVPRRRPEGVVPLLG